ncbi:hypothetical protein VP01_2315g2 [Puccinia sorghi]|uniref:Uncharacterized protein n=1 Tax=Puccinia sorghi TaxID=27349 RepID=A0A0L6V7R3_9BASI|nr:hypothetical protein VP01_2315g2 [Puccinia sorghi]
MSLTTLHYDTFKLLNSDCSLPLVASLQSLITSVSCSLINMRTLVDSLDCHLTSRTSQLYNYDLNVSSITPGIALSETTRRFIKILRQLDKGILDQIIILDALQKRSASAPLPSATSKTLYSPRTTLGDSQSRKLTLQLSIKIRRVSSRLESFADWTDSILMASLADSARGDIPKDGASRLDQVEHEKTHDALIDGCVDVTHGSWSIRAQLAQAHAVLNGTLSQARNQNDRSLSLPRRLRKSTARRSKPIFQYEAGDSLARRLRNRSFRKFQPRNLNGVGRSITWLVAFFDPYSSLTITRAAINFLQNKS